MNTPIVDFTEKYAASDVIRAHMPGHKGEPSFYGYDITEINGADSLFEAKGIIAESERNAAALFGADRTVYSAGGSTLCIQTMAAMCGGYKRRIAAARNCHRSFIHACAFLDIRPDWIFPDYKDSLLSGSISPEAVEEKLKTGDKPACVYITSPDYLGHMQDIDGISEVCRRYGVPLAVDNAHGAYLRFIYSPSDGKPLHPIFHGADICCDSAHKTLPVLTGGAYLHIMGDKSRFGDPKEIMQMFASSSPSYLILRSLDACNSYMSVRAERELSEMAAAAESVKSELKSAWDIEDTEPGKLTVFAPPSGYHGFELARRLREKGIECEYGDSTHTVLMLTGLSTEKIYRIGEALRSVPQPRITVPVCSVREFEPPERAMSIRDAAFAESETVPAEKATGRICAKTVTCCPPGVAVTVSGEIFSESHINILKNYSILSVNVVK
ncbi:MAG: amino acid decarboxylase [Ruminococcus sp.]|nr:amino acid decarboxylase [Ruminococcus sp.]